MAAGSDDEIGGGREAADLAEGPGPGRPGQVIRLHPQTGQRHLDWLIWGLRSAAHADRDLAPIHARAETVAELPLFADAYLHRRAIVPAAEYYQRRTIGGSGERYAIARRDGKPLAIAGLWNAVRQPDGVVLRTYCIITVEAQGAVAGIHDRMPLVLEAQDWPVWLGEVVGDPATLLRPRDGELLVLRPVRGRRSQTSRVPRRNAAGV